MNQVIKVFNQELKTHDNNPEVFGLVKGAKTMEKGINSAISVWIGFVVPVHVSRVVWETFLEIIFYQQRL